MMLELRSCCRIWKNYPLIHYQLSILPAANLPVLLYLYDICTPERFTALNFIYEDIITLPETIQVDGGFNPVFSGY